MLLLPLLPFLDVDKRRILYESVALPHIKRLAPILLNCGREQYWTRSMRR
jgi:hypothetical protein